MLLTTSLVLFAAVVGAGIFKVLSGWRANIIKARAIGLPYLSLLVHPWNGFWLITFWLWVPIIKIFPKSWWENWLFILLPDWGYNSLQEPWDRLGDSFVVATPFDLTLYTNDAGVISQVSTRRDQFPKDTSMYSLLGVFGQNVVITEGAQWKMHRKATAASFNERNAASTFGEAIRQTQGFLGHLEMDAKGSSKTLKTLDHDTLILALNIIGYVGFGIRFLWPQEQAAADADPRFAKYSSLKPTAGFSMSFADSLAETLEKILAILLIPKFLLKTLPFEATKKAWEAYDNYNRYMKSFLQDKIDDVQSGAQEKEGMDLMGQLVRTKYGGKSLKGGSTSAGPAAGELSDSEIIGNAFMIIVAGHETTANTLHFTLLQLATNPAAQRKVQADVDRLFGDSDPATWGFEANINAMLASHLGAVMNETLRLMPSVVALPKRVAPGQDQVVAVEGSKHVLPAGMTVTLSAVNVHRNPRYWPARPSTVTPKKEHDLDDYVPDRWFRSSSELGSSSAIDRKDTAGSMGSPLEGPGGESSSPTAAQEPEDLGGFKGPDTSASLFRPARGSFVPFSDGARSCLGRRIAQVETVASFAVIFQRYSVELAVDEWASDAEVDAMAAEERVAVYAKAQDKARRTMQAAKSVITLKLQGGDYVPVRFVKRGSERMIDVVDA